MKTPSLLWGLLALGTTLLLAGCDPSAGGGRYYGGYDPYSGGSYSRSNGYYDPYYGGTYYDPRWRREAYRDLQKSHEEKHEQLEHKYDKAMHRLDRQEHEAEEKLYRKYGGNTSDPRYQEAQRKIDQKYDHKRDKVERNTRHEHNEFHRDLGW
jgi:hypothetical protein